MIKLNGIPMELKNFPDGTLLMKFPQGYSSANHKEIIEWHYEGDGELFALICLTNQLRDKGIDEIHLYMPYIPNARQDRVKTEEDVFTLKWFAKIINSLNFSSVISLDPHSYVSMALIDKLVVEDSKDYVGETLKTILDIEKEYPTFFYPDEGASKRYSGIYNLPYAFGNKRRKWENGEIIGLDVAGATEEIAGKNILIVDDICSKGGTFFYAAKKLKALGAKNIYLFVSHCENTILDGELINSGLLNGIFTTDSIFTKNHPLITVYECGGEKYV